MPTPKVRKPLYAYLGFVTGIDTENRRIDVKYSGSERGKKNVVVIGDYGSNSLPSINDMVFLIEFGPLVYCIGKMEPDFKSKLGKITDEKGNIKYIQDKNTGAKLLAKEVQDGEVFLINLAKRVWLHLSNDGGISLLNGMNDGLRYFSQSSILRLKGLALNLFGLGTDINFGSVNRDIPGKGQTTIPGDLPTVPAIEAMINLAQAGIKFARFHIGHVKNALGIDEFGSWGSRIRAIVEVCTAGVPMGVLKMDELGNIEVKSTSGFVMLDGNPVGGVQLGGLGAVQSAVLGDQLLTWLNSHTHSTGTGPSGIPIIIAPTTILSQKVKVGP